MSILDKIDHELIVRLTKTMISMDSQNPPGKTVQIVNFLEEECRKLGFEVKIHPIDENRHNISVFYGSGEKDIILCGHLDTVPVGDESNWHYPPLEGTETSGKIFGRGSADMLGGVGTLIAVMDLLKKSGFELSHRVVFLGTADEEVGMNGANYLKKCGVMNQAACLIITEATELRVGIAEKGPYWVRFIVKGKAAHGSLPNEGINAIEGAVELIKSVKTMLPDIDNVYVGKSTINVGLINGGTKTNIVPEECIVDCDFRLVPEVNLNEFKEKLSTLTLELSQKYPQKFFFEIIHELPALSTNVEHPLIQNLLNWSSKVAGVPNEPIGLSYATDAAGLIPPKEIPFAIIGGGSPTVIHKANEYVVIQELIDAAKIITAAILQTYSK